MQQQQRGSVLTFLTSFTTNLRTISASLTTELNMELPPSMEPFRLRVPALEEARAELPSLRASAGPDVDRFSSVAALILRATKSVDVLRFRT